MLVEKVMKGESRALLELCSPAVVGRAYYVSALLVGEGNEAKKCVISAVERVTGEILRQDLCDDAAVPSVLLTRALSSAKAVLTKENPKLMKAPAGKKFTLTPTDGKSADASGALAMMPSLTRFIYVLSALGSYDEKAISDMAGVSIETVKAALAVRDSNVRALSTIGGEEELTVEICAGINTAVADDELYGRAKEKIDGALAPIMERRAAVKKKMGIIGGIALGAVALISAVIILFATGVLGGGSGEKPLFEEVTVDMNKTYYADINIKNYGTITVKLDQSEAPITVSNFVRLAESGFYNGLTFHRIIEGFMMQGGDPEANGMGGSDQKIKGEFELNGVDNDIEHVRGVISMARAGYSNDSASSQFFIVHEDSRDSLDGKYAAFGKVISGIDIVDRICEDAIPSDSNGTIPYSRQPVINSITIRVEDK